MSFLRVVLLAVCLVAALPHPGESATITLTMPEFTGPLPIGTFPGQPLTVGTFDLGVAVDDILSATLSGTFGNSLSPSSSGVDVFLDGLQVAQCVPSTACTMPPGPDSWSYTFTSLQIDQLFADGIGVMTAVQTGGVFVRLGNLALTLETPDPAHVPEPSSIALMLAGLAAVAVRSYRRSE